jgi:hypothetical protein
MGRRQNCLFVETLIVNRAVRDFFLPDDVRQGNAIDSWDGNSSSAVGPQGRECPFLYVTEVVEGFESLFSDAVVRSRLIEPNPPKALL